MKHRNVSLWFFKIASCWFFPARNAPRFLIDVEQSHKDMEASVWLLPLTAIQHLKWFNLSKFDSINFTNASTAKPNCWFIPIQPLRHYWYILIRHYSGSSCWGNIIIGSWCEGLVCKHKMTHELLQYIIWRCNVNFIVWRSSANTKQGRVNCHCFSSCLWGKCDSDFIRGWKIKTRWFNKQRKMNNIHLKAQLVANHIWKSSFSTSNRYDAWSHLPGT